MCISEADFHYIRDLVYRISGNVLENDKSYLVESRLDGLLRAEGFSSFAELVAAMRQQPRNGLHWHVVEAMTTSETYFFRDIYPFELLKTSLIPELMNQRVHTNRLNIWCAAAASGQEPYSILMLLRDQFPSLSNWEINLLATDISTKMLDRCIEGRYSQMEINRGLPATYVVKYFERRGLEWQVKEELRRMLKVRQANLAESWPALPMMDIIFLRNVLIYFDIDVKRAVMNRVRKILQPDGYLFLGGAETALNIDQGFERIQVGRGVCYRLRG